MDTLKGRYIGLILLFALGGLTSCAQFDKYSSDSTPSKPIVTPYDPQSAVPKELAELSEIKPVNPFLAGLSAKEIEQVKKEALRVYGRDWRVIGIRSQYVRAPMLKALDEVGAPTELQIVPVVESSYNPYAQSEVGASGLWQLMPQTAKELKIKSTRHFDGRRDIAASTKGAAKFLMRQHRRFGNWPMAFASYHLGPGGVQRRLDRRPWQPGDGLKRLPPPPITKTYVRHLLGLIALHDEGRLSFPAPYPTKKIKLQTPVNLADLHKKSGLPEHQIFRFNPKLGLAQYYDDKPSTIELRVSQKRVDSIKKQIPAKPPTFVTIQVESGETMRDVSRKYGASIGEILRANPGLPPVRLAKGQKIRIPARLLSDEHAETNPLAKPTPSLVAAN